MAGPWKQLGLSSALLALLMLVLVLVVGLLGGTVLPFQQMLLLAGVALLLFVGGQLLVFRLLGLRSRADEERKADEDEDWRVWRG